MAVEKVRQKRQCGPRVKTGCQTCRIRRVKCGEEKPACKRCSETGRKCDGYIAESLGLEEQSPSLAAVQRVMPHVSGSVAEKRGFGYFITNTAAELSGYYSSAFWERLVLQAASGEPSLRHAVIAIGSLHEDFANKRLEYSQEADSGFALNQYAKAIAHLRKSLSNGIHSPLTALLSCILFVTFDSIRGSFTTAMVHLQSGLRILRDLRKNPSGDSALIEEMLAPLFMRLSLQAILYIDTRSVQERRDLTRETMIPVSHNNVFSGDFHTLEECRDSINAAANGLFRVFYMCEGDRPFREQPAYSFELHQEYKQQIDDWVGRFDRFMTIKSKTMSDREIRGAALLKIQQLTVTIMSEMSPPDVSDPRKNTPDAFIPYTPHFETIVNLSRSLITASEQDASVGKPALTFSADTGVVAPLWYTCTNCQDETVRIVALEQLKRCSRREGMWDGNVMADMIGSYWAIQQQHKEKQVENEALNIATIPISKVVRMKLGDGMKWGWTWLSEPDEI